jgi:hypothetical protein
MPKSTILAQGRINLSDQVVVWLVEPDNDPPLVTDEPPRIRVEWPPYASVTVPDRHAEVASAAMKVLAAAVTKLSQIRASKYR